MAQLEQAKALIHKSQNIYIVSPEQHAYRAVQVGAAGDIFCSATALFFTLKKMGKNVNVIPWDVPQKFLFLAPDQQKNKNQFALSIDTTEKELGEIRYEKAENRLKIFLEFTSGSLEQKDISLDSEASPHIISEKPDLFIALGAKSQEDIGKLFKEHSNLFYETPILNIDNDLANEQFGEVNLVSMTSSPIAGIVTTVIKDLDESFIDGGIATYLLAGIISASQNFQHPRTNPKSFDTAAFLLDKGADHQRIVQHLYKQKSISQIRILGRVLQNLQFDASKELYWATLLQKDFKDLLAKPKDLVLAIEELRSGLQKTSSLLLLWESHASPPAVRGVMYSPRTDTIEKILNRFEGDTKGESALFVIREEDIEVAKHKLFTIL